MLRSVTAFVVASPLALVALGAQSPTPPRPQDVADPSSKAPRFEVASIRPNLSSSRSTRWSYQGETFRYTNGSLADIIRFAYGVGSPGAMLGPIYERPFGEVEGMPDWATNRYDIDAKTAGPLGALATKPVGPVHVMVQSLLAERFTLATHWETRERPAYALVRPPGNPPLGPGIQPADPKVCEEFRAALRIARIDGTPAPARPVRSNPRMPACGSSSYPDWMRMVDHSMKEVAEVFGFHLRRPVTDETGLDGVYDIELIFRRESSNAGDPAQPVPNAPTLAEPLSLPEAIREQLNLRLEPRRGMVDVLVIDHLERPTEN